jgi:hypothetical protein
MKKFAMLALLLSLSTLTIGCKPAEKKADAPAAAPAADAPAADAPAAEEKK